MYTESLKRGVLQKVNNELMVVLYSNRAMAYLKLREYIKAEDDCNNALKLNEKHVKSLVRRGQAKRRLEKFKEALRDYKNALEVEPNNKEIQEEIRVITKKIANTKDERKKNLVLVSAKPVRLIRSIGSPSLSDRKTKDHSKSGGLRSRKANRREVRHSKAFSGGN